MSKATDKLLAISPDTPDRTVVLLIADAMTESEREPYCFSINHSIRPPKCERCPLPYDWAHGAKVGITKKSRAEAETWLAHALMKGYTAERVAPRGHEPDGGMCTSLARTRRAAVLRQYVQSHPDLDDDIPF